MPIEDLAPLLKQHRGREALSLRAAAAEAGVSFNTLARIERGHLPDTDNLLKVIAWLGVDADQILGRAQLRPQATLEIVTRHLRSDPALSTEAAERIEMVIRDMYGVLAKPALPTAAHLRAARTFVPEAGRMLAELLEEMEEALTTRGA